MSFGTAKCVLSMKFQVSLLGSGVLIKGGEWVFIKEGQGSSLKEVSGSLLKRVRGPH